MDLKEVPLGLPFGIYFLFSSLPLLSCMIMHKKSSMLSDAIQPLAEDGLDVLGHLDPINRIDRGIHMVYRRSEMTAMNRHNYGLASNKARRMKHGVQDKTCEHLPSAGYASYASLHKPGRIIQLGEAFKGRKQSTLSQTRREDLWCRSRLRRAIPDTTSQVLRPLDDTVEMALQKIASREEILLSTEKHNGKQEVEAQDELGKGNRSPPSSYLPNINIKQRQDHQLDFGAGVDKTHPLQRTLTDGIRLLSTSMGMAGKEVARTDTGEGGNESLTARKTSLNGSFARGSRYGAPEAAVIPSNITSCTPTTSNPEDKSTSSYFSSTERVPTTSIGTVVFNVVYTEATSSRNILSPVNSTAAGPLVESSHVLNTEKQLGRESEGKKPRKTLYRNRMHGAERGLRTGSNEGSSSVVPARSDIKMNNYGAPRIKGPSSLFAMREQARKLPSHRKTATYPRLQHCHGCSEKILYKENQMLSEAESFTNPSVDPEQETVSTLSTEQDPKFGRWKQEGGFSAEMRNMAVKPAKGVKSRLLGTRKHSIGVTKETLSQLGLEQSSSPRTVKGRISGRQSTEYTSVIVEGKLVHDVLPREERPSGDAKMPTCPDARKEEEANAHPYWLVDALDIGNSY